MQSPNPDTQENSNHSGGHIIDDPNRSPNGGVDGTFLNHFKPYAVLNDYLANDDRMEDLPKMPPRSDKFQFGIQIQPQADYTHSPGISGLAGAYSSSNSTESVPQRFPRGQIPGVIVNGGSRNQADYIKSAGSSAAKSNTSSISQTTQIQPMRKESDAYSTYSNESGVSNSLSFVPHSNLESYRQEIKISRDPVKHFEFGKQLILVAEGIHN